MLDVYAGTFPFSFTPVASVLSSYEKLFSFKTALLVV
jgi:hypothetical protein